MSEQDIYSPPKSDVASTAIGDDALLETELASRWARLGAAILDGVVLIVLFMALLFLTGTLEAMATGEQSPYQEVLGAMVGLVLYLVVNGYLLHRSGQTVGKWALGIKIVSINDGRILPLWQVVLVRYLPQVLVSVIPVIGQWLVMIESLFVFRRDKRCVHDLIAGTRVIRERDYNPARAA